VEIIEILLEENGISCSYMVQASMYKHSSLEGNIIRDEAFITTACLGGDNFTGSDDMIKR
jgi:hypothetical protein